MAIRTDLSRSFGIARFVPQTSKDFVHATLEMTRLLRSKRLNFCSVIVVVVVVFFLRLLNVDLVSVLKLNKRNLVKFQPSWPHAWSTTHAYPFLGDYKNNGAARRKRFKKRALRGTRISFCGHDQIHSSPLSKTTPVLKRNHLRKP